MTSPTTSAARPRFRLGFLTHVEGRGDASATYRHAQELFVAADELGFDVGWVAQHHVPLFGGGLPSPWTFLAHAAALTRRIRLGTAITILPLEDPVRLAEDVSTVDTLSGGRVETGVGSGASDVEYAVLGRDVTRRRELASEGLAVLRRALANQEVTEELRREKVLPVATDLTTQFNPAIINHDTAVRALELIATEVAPALGWTPATAPAFTPAPAGPSALAAASEPAGV